MGANELSMHLWRERELLEMLLFKLEEQELLLAAGRSRWIHFATREVEQVLERIRQEGLGRAVEVSGVAEEWGAPDDATLRQLIEHAPTDAWRDVFTEHLRAMTELTAEVAQRRDANEVHLRAAVRATQEAIAGLGIRTGEYDADGTVGPDDSSPRIVDTAL
ncbi:flagellar export chaperone FlgN [Microbacterium marinilacus]|uniref:Flagellar protein FlgN n=1 Tax=Microbacterium marinilacus TaxID=415209 RepID=A0ABP7B6N7_9MICO|nr:flagellar export chaperone FlgN [Microbacterium marinilacus]MBY0687742.1 flagellar protein FlgN [Microbacterium marinilacus]